MKAVSIAEMQELEQRAIRKIGIPAIVLMENAGRISAEIVLEMLKGAEKRSVSLFCGIGNNGGDGFVAARHLANKGVKINVYITGDRPKIKNDAKINLDILRNMDVAVNEIYKPIDINADVIIDGIFGIGIKGEVKEPIRGIIENINASGISIVSIDVPSGLDADTGNILGVSIKAVKTVTMQFPKKGFYLNKGPEYAGEIIAADIGIPQKERQKCAA